MNRKDKDNLLILGFILGCIILFAFFNFITQRIYFIVLVGIILAVQTFLIIPSICKNYYNLNGMEIGITRFIPFYQELTIFPVVIARILAILWVICFALILLITIGSHSGLIGSVLGLELVLTLESAFNDLIANILAVLIIASNILVGIGFTNIKKDVDRMDDEFSSVRVSRMRFSSVIYIILLYIPVFRCVSLCNIFNTLFKLTKINKYTGISEETNLIEEDEE